MQNPGLKPAPEPERNTVEIRINTRDLITPALTLLANAAQRTETMEAAGMAIASLARRAIREPGLRPEPWPARSSPGSHQLLRKSGTLWRSIAISHVTPTSVTIASDRIYAAVQQFGATIVPKTGKFLAFPWGAGGPMVFAKKVKIPARPFFPITAGGQFTDRARRAVEGAIVIKLRKFGIFSADPFTDSGDGG